MGNTMKMPRGIGQEWRRGDGGHGRIAGHKEGQVMAMDTSGGEENVTHR